MEAFTVHFSNPIHGGIFLSLLFFSLLSWSIIFSKVFDLIGLKKKIKVQEELLTYCKKTDLKQWHKKLSTQNKSDFFIKIYEQVEQTLTHSVSYNAHIHLTLQKYLELFLQEEEQKRVQGLSWLATIANVSPYVGLLGTLAGVMHTFSLMSGQGSGLTQLAPGLAEALQATAAGLLVAIPANIAYNKLVASYKTHLQKLSSQGEYLLLHIDTSFRSFAYDSQA
jgi:biopolymer transport protein TolQ